MEKLSSAVMKPLEQSNYVKPLTLFYTQNNKEKSWDFLAVHDSVAVIIYNTTRNVLVFVKQFRPPVYIMSIPLEHRTGQIDTTKYPASLGVTLELCAGIVDKNLSLADIAAEEVLEECGYKVSSDMLEKVSSYRSGVGTSGSVQTLYYCEVTDDMKVNEGGGVDDEIIDIVEMTVSDLKKFLTKEHILSPPSFLFAMYWFLAKQKQ